MSNTMTTFETIENEIITLLSANKELKNFTFISSKTFFNQEALSKEAHKNAKGAIAIKVTKANPVKQGNSRLLALLPMISVVLFNKDLGQVNSNLGLYKMIDLVITELWKNQYQFIDDSPLEIEDVKGVFVHGLEFQSEKFYIIEG
jgi:hypothetical protein